MKKLHFFKLLVLVACLSSALGATAYDFSYTYNDKRLYFNITDATNKTVEVTYCLIGDSYSAPTGDVTIPSTVTYNGTTYTVTGIGEHSFHSTGLTMNSVSIPSTVTYIGDYAFYNQSRLTSITLPSSLTSIGSRAFRECSGLTSITIPNSVNIIRSSAFCLCSSLTSVNLGTGVKTLESDVFYNCPALQSVTGGSNLETIGSRAFYLCSSLSEFVIPDKVTSIGYSAFYDCTNITKMTVGKSVTSIGDYAFAFNGVWQEYEEDCMIPVEFHFKSILPPTIQQHTFSSKTDPATEDYNFNPYMRHTVYVDGPYALSKYQTATYWSYFYTYSRMYRETPYDFVYNSIYYNISDYNNKTAKVCNKYGEGRPSWSGYSGDYSYKGSVTIPATAYDSDYSMTYTVTGIAKNAFDETPRMMINGSEAPSLRNQGDLKSVVVVGPNVATIEQDAFKNCTGLTSVTLGAYVDNIGAEAFYGCTALTTVISRRVAPPTLQSTTFDTSHYTNATVYVPTAAAVTSYKAATYWKNFTSIKVIPTLNEALNVSGGNLSFTSTGTYPWMVVADESGFYAMSSNNSYHSTSSAMTTSVTVPTGGASLTFDFKAWGEGTSSIYDKCIFSVDGVEQFRYGARQNDWETYTVQLTAGTHTLTWTYSKDSSVNPVGDYFAVRNVKLNVEAYACWSNTNPAVLTFYYDGLRSTRTYSNSTGTSITFDLNTGSNTPGWISSSSVASSIALVVFDPSFANARPTSTYSWFIGLPVQSISGLSYLNTENVTNMAFMFSGCSGLTSLDLSSFNTAKVTSMMYMFHYCSNLTNIDLSNFNTANVTSMYYMFGNCTNLTTIYAGSGWNTDAVTSSGYMFYNCTKLVGGKGTTYNSSHTDKAYAHIDGGTSNPGYFTALGMTGDVNGDNAVTIADVTALIDILLSGATAPAGADCNNDGQVTIADVTALIDYLLSGSW